MNATLETWRIGNGRCAPSGAELDEKLWRLGNAMRDGRVDKWGFDFGRSLLRQAKRPTWAPTPKQLAVLDRLLDAATKTGGPELLIDYGDQPVA